MKRFKFVDFNMFLYVFIFKREKIWSFNYIDLVNKLSEEPNLKYTF